MLVRDKVGEKLIETISKTKKSEIQIVKLDDNEEFLQALFSKIKNELEILELTRSPDSIAEICELFDWVQICLGSLRIDDIIEERKDKLGLYWERYYIKDKGVE